MGCSACRAHDRFEVDILEYQREHDIQLIVLGAFSHSKIHQFFLGSITTNIFRNSTVPLLVAK